MDELLKELKAITVNRQAWLSDEVANYCDTHKRFDCGLNFNPTVGRIVHKCRCPMPQFVDRAPRSSNTQITELERVEAIEMFTIEQIGGYREVPLKSRKKQLIKLRLCLTPHCFGITVGGAIRCPSCLKRNPL